MGQTRDLLKGGIEIEEKFIVEIGQEIIKTKNFEDLDQTRKDRIIPLLEVLLNDSIRHKKILEEIINKLPNE